nr:MAG TPA: hypothetical protein [Caudoviricetes sp.]DAX87805.1 MAG TPA: hypothetical protein [Caudoviricetes sp.]
MSICIGLSTRKQKTSRKVANWTVITDVAHFVFQKKMKRMAMHICDMLTNNILLFIFCLLLKSSPVANESVLR